MEYALIGLMGEKYGTPYKDFPLSAMEFDKGGIAEWCDTCGCLIGGALVLSFFWASNVAR